MTFTFPKQAENKVVLCCLIILIVAMSSTGAFSFSPQHQQQFKTRTTTTTNTVTSKTLSSRSYNKSSPILFEKKTMEVVGQDAKTTKDDDNQEQIESTKTFLSSSSSLESPSNSVPKENEEDMSESKKLLKKIKESGTAGVISYALWELGFWALSVPVCIYAYYKLVGHMPDFSNQEDLAKLGGEAFAFVNFARFAVPLRIGLALSTTPWIQENIVDSFLKKEEKEQE